MEEKHTSSKLHFFDYFTNRFPINRSIEWAQEKLKLNMD